MDHLELQKLTCRMKSLDKDWLVFQLRVTKVAAIATGNTWMFSTFTWSRWNCIWVGKVGRLTVYLYWSVFVFEFNNLKEGWLGICICICACSPRGTPTECCCRESWSRCSCSRPHPPGEGTTMSTVLPNYDRLLYNDHHHHYHHYYYYPPGEGTTMSTVLPK